MSSLVPDDVKRKVEALALPFLADAGIDLVELNISRRNGDVMIQFLADRPEGGITMSECSNLNRSIALAIDADGFLGDGYELEFSSPGLDRPLQTAGDFRRNVGREVRLLLQSPVDGKKELTGVLSEAGMQELTLSVKRKQNIVVPLSQVHKGMLVL